ncbi:MAG: twin-arginine translocase TatA/TatE family subunit [Actinomycetota bacterium]|nr:twin-arginine translocase TatA/TatE family subunit [Actinomycetota bacterium]
MFTGLESPTHLLILLAIILLLFGAKRVPELGRSLGRGISEFKEGLSTKDESPTTAEEQRSGALEGEQAKAKLATGNGPQDEQGSHAKDSRS